MALLDYYLLLSPLVTFGLSLSLTALVLLKNPRSSSHRFFAVFLMSLTLWGGFIFNMRNSIEIAHALSWERAVMPVYMLSAISFWYFSFSLSRRRKKRWSNLAANLFLVIILVLAPTDLLVKELRIDQFGYYPGPGILFYIIPLGAYYFYFTGLYNFIRAYRSSSSYEEKNSYLYIMIGVSSFLAAGLVEVVVVFGITIPPITIVGGIVFAVLASIALLKYHLLDIQVALRRGLTYVLLSAAFVIPFAVFLIMFNYFFNREVPIWAYLGMLIILAFTLRPLWNKTQQLVDRWFYRERYDFLNALEHFTQETHDITDLHELGNSITNLVRNALQANTVQLLLKNENGAFEVTPGEKDNPAKFAISGNSPVINWFKLNSGILHSNDIDSVPQLQAVWQRDLIKLKKMNTELLVPLKNKQEELIGILILARKISGAPYTREEIRLVLSISAQVATELENARLYYLERTSRQELEKQDKQKTEFLHQVAHELKTPLTAVISSSELLSEESNIDQSMRERMIENIKKSAGNLDRRVTELLDFARIQNEDIIIHPELHEMKDIISDIDSQVRILFENKNQRFVSVVEDPLPKIEVDKEKLEQVLVNLLSNANKFSPSGSEIKIKASNKENVVIVEVEDSAPIVADEEKTKIFDAYYRSSNSDKSGQLPGLGLGLAIAKKIIELHQGKIWVESPSGKGNIFAFSLPVLDKESKIAGE